MQRIDTSDSRVNLLPREMVELLIETGKHPELLENLRGVDELAEWFAIVASYCQLPVDGAFGPRELRDLTIQLKGLLQQKRTKILIVSH